MTRKRKIDQRAAGFNREPMKSTNEPPGLSRRHFAAANRFDTPAVIADSRSTFIVRRAPIRSALTRSAVSCYDRNFDLPATLDP
jgi:hypothetical protein